MADSGFGYAGKVLATAIKDLETKSSAFESRIRDLGTDEEGLSQSDMLNLQYELGQYNAFIESVSNVTKAMNDTLKSLSQKAG